MGDPDENLGLETELKGQKKISLLQKMEKAISKIIEAEGFEKYLHEIVGLKDLV